MMPNIEKAQLSIGFIPLTDAAPMVIAKEVGFFEKHGLTVELKKQNSWATLRDRLHAGVLDAAQMLAPMPLASTLGCGSKPVTVVAPIVLSLNGNAITWSETLHQDILESNGLSQVALPAPASLLKPVVESRAVNNRPKLRFADVFPFSCHHYQLKQWLKDGGIEEDRVELITVPPVNMVSFMETGDIDGFCVGGPWNTKAVRAGLGMTAVTSFDISPDMPEKVLGITREFAQRHPNTVTALCAAVLEACAWLDKTPNRFEAARLLTRPEYIDAPLDIVAPSLLGSCLTHASRSPRVVNRYNLFYDPANTINAPNPAFGNWLCSQLADTGQMAINVLKDEILSIVYDDTIYQQALALTALNRSKFSG